ncbi:MAG: hypothetical protein NTZ12_04005 [Candidatus Aminicenantes bacterium]|nr:hypothetical protein [Candidatus Aminicenantes bacterium]
MKRIKVFSVALALLVLAACGGSGTTDQAKPEDKTGIGRIAAERAASAESRAVSPKAASGTSLRISVVRISPADLFANVDLNAEALVVPPVPEVIDFEYRWFVTNREVADASGPILPSGNFRKHQSGLLTWQIDDKTIERLGETIVISLSVGDNDGQPTTGTLTLRFQKNIATQPL